MHTLNAQMTMPVSEAVHDVIEACGFQLQNQEFLCLEYYKRNDRGADQRLEILIAGSFKINAYRFLPDIEDDRAAEWHHEFSIAMRIGLTDQAIVDLLQSLGVIDYTQLEEYKHVIEQVRRKAKPVQALTIAQLNKAMSA